MKRKIKFYKSLDETGFSCHGGEAEWSLPYRNEDGTWVPGDWMPEIEGELKECENGYHVASFRQLIYWLAPRIFDVEVGHEIVKCRDKYIVRKIRLTKELTNWNEGEARLFACDCAERVLPIYEAKHPNDIRPRNAIEVARLFVNTPTKFNALRFARDAACEAEAHAEDAASRYVALSAIYASSTYTYTEFSAADAARAAVSAVREAAKAEALARGLNESEALSVGLKAMDAMEEWQVMRLSKILC